MRRITGILCVWVGTLLASGVPVRQVSLHIPDETVPPGGVAQMKFMVTEPTPVSSGKPILSFDTALFDGVWGVELFSPDGDVNGVAMVDGSHVSVTYTTTAGARGNDYPIMTVAMHVRPDATPGTQTHFALDPASSWILRLLNATTLKPEPPATVTVGGSISITNVVPGGGLLSAGSTVSIHGLGFQPNTQVQLNAIRSGSITVVSPTEIQFTLAQDTQMTGQKIQVVNPDGSQDVYFSYLRGLWAGRSARPLLAGAIPVFSSVLHQQGVFAPIAAAGFAGLALQNPGTKAAEVTIELYSSTNALLGTGAVSLDAGYRVMKEISEFVGATPAFGSYVVVKSSMPIQMFGFWADDAARTIVPFTALP